MIVSPKNPKVAFARKLRDRKQREASEQFIVEGLKEVQKALANGFDLVTLFVCEDLLNPDSNALVAQVDPRLTLLVGSSVFAKIALREGRDGLFGIFHQRTSTLAQIETEGSQCLLVLEGVEKPGNLGAVLRVADGLGAAAVVCIDSPIDIFNPNVVRASLGALFSLPVIQATYGEFVAWLPPSWSLVTTWPDMEGHVPHYAVPMEGPTAIVMGAEDTGLRSRWREQNGYGAYIPMNGQCDSLNLSVATAVFGYEWLRRTKTAQ